MACAYEPRVVRGLGWTLVVLGCLSVTLGVAADIAFADHRTPFHFFSAPVWSGLLVDSNWVIRGKTDRDYQTFDCTPHSISLHAVNIFLALLEIILGFVVSILSCCEMCTIRRLAAQICDAVADFPEVGNVITSGVHQKWREDGISHHHGSERVAGPVPGGADGNIVVMQGTTGAQGSQPQMFLAQNPGAAGAPVQVFYPAQQAPPPYQVDPGAASGAHEEKKVPLPVDSV
ncbi:hypothetical protein Bbelb_027650 [Branchiostoma belcheri]|nr:hypothetical protein Bbelb_027650 [Branchiostoma belcheri]